MDRWVSLFSQTAQDGNRSRLKDRDKWYIIPDHHPAIVDQAIFEQAKAKQLRFPQPNKKKRDYPLKGKIFCGCCGHALSYSCRKTPYYYCQHSNADENKPCYKIRFDAKALEDAVFTTLKSQMDVLGSDGIKRATQGNTVVSQHSEYECQINALEESKLRLYEQYQLREIDLDTFKAKKEALNAQLLKIENAYAALTAQVKRDQKAKEKEIQRRSIAN